MKNLINRLFAKTRNECPIEGKEFSGWDTSHWNFSGKNIYFFRDQCHISQETQDKLANEMQKIVEQSRIEYLFSEGGEGLIFLYGQALLNPFFNNLSESAFRKLVLKSQDCVPASFLASIKGIQNKNLLVYGVEDPALLTLGRKYLKRKSELVEKYQLTEDQNLFEELERNQVLFEAICVDRSHVAVKNIIEKMKKEKLTSAGVLFGDGHFEDMTRDFLKNGFGWASYNPGEISINLNDVINYGRNFEY